MFILSILNNCAVNFSSYAKWHYLQTLYNAKNSKVLYQFIWVKSSKKKWLHLVRSWLVTEPVVDLAFLLLNLTDKPTSKHHHDLLNLEICPKSTFNFTVFFFNLKVLLSIKQMSFIYLIHLLLKYAVLLIISLWLLTGVTFLAVEIPFHEINISLWVRCGPNEKGSVMTMF